VREGLLNASFLDAAAARSLALRARIGLFDPPTLVQYNALTNGSDAVLSPAHVARAAPWQRIRGPAAGALDDEGNGGLPVRVVLTRAGDPACTPPLRPLRTAVACCLWDPWRRGRARWRSWAPPSTTRRSCSATTRTNLAPGEGPHCDVSGGPRTRSLPTPRSPPRSGVFRCCRG